mgnify:CR=1 FL=1
MTSYEWPEPPRPVAFSIARPGVPLIGAAAFVTLILALVQWRWMALAALGATLFIACFFRDPERAVPAVEGAVVSPADGRVVAVRKLEGHPLYGGPCLQVSIFMSVFNVHVNRAPVAGRVEAVDYHPGRFVSAHLDKASADNERNAVTLEAEGGLRVVVVQIAGLVARRIICDAAVGHQLERGQRFGMICFGSRLDVYLPPDAAPACAAGDRVRAGTSIVGRLA